MLETAALRQADRPRLFTDDNHETIALQADAHSSPVTFGRWSRSCGVLESETPRPPRVCDVSIIIGSYNRRALLREAINAIRHNGFNGTMEIVVVDGGSTDGTLAWLAEQKDIITIIQHNRGEVDGRPIERRSWGYFINLCFKLAQGKYVMMLSDDCITKLYN